MPAGRPSEYSSQIIPEVSQIAASGATDQEIADSIGISTSTYYRWRQQFPEFREAIKENKDEVDRRVENALFAKALAGDTTASIFWLKNRKRADWRDRTEHTGVDGGPVEFVVKSILEEK